MAVHGGSAPDAFAQGATIGIYTDQAGTTCSFSGDAPGTVTAYVVCRPTVAGVRAVQFSAPLPPCLGATIEEEITPVGALSIGSVETGISIVLPQCSALPAVVLKIIYSRSGSTTPCCEYPIVADPGPGVLSTVDCAGAEVSTTGLVSHFNADASCACAGNSQPSIPDNPMPPDFADGQSVATSMSWSATDIDGNLAEYDLYLGTSPSPPLVAAGLTQANYTPSAALEPLTRYYWRVVARDALGLETAGFTWTFTTRLVNSPPDAPRILDPPDGAQNVPLDVIVRWTALDIDEDPLVFDLYFGTSSTPALVAADLTLPEYSPGPLSYETSYYWRVVARDPLGHEATGPVWNFFTRPANFPPNPPANISPADLSKDRPLTTTLSWAASDPENDPLVFDVYMWVHPSPPTLVATGLTTRSYSPASLTFLTWYHWKVVARDDQGRTAPGPEWIFQTRPENYPPAKPSNPSPTNDARNRPVTSTLGWQCSDPDGGPITFYVYFGATAPPPLVASDVATNSYDPGPLAFLRTYWWMIVARDPYGAETAGPTWSFTTKANSAPSAPSNPNPPHNSSSTLLSPVLSWAATDPDGQPLRYNVYFGTTSPPPLVTSGLTEPTYAPGALEPLAQYFWRVVVSDGALSTSGPTWSFTTIPPGDVDGDGTITLADASCALHVFVGMGGCAAAGGALAADVNCSAGVTPRDARCIHKQVVDGSCPFCGGAGEAPAPVTLAPLVTAGPVWESDDTLNVSLFVAGVPLLESFGFNLSTDSRVRLVGLVRRGATSAFEAMEMGVGGAGELSWIGGYALTGVPAVSKVELVRLRFVVDSGSGGYAFIEGFVDDLAGAGHVIVSLGGGGDPTPVLFTRFEAVLEDGGVDVRWELKNDEAMESFTLYRREGAAPLADVIAQGPINTRAGSYLDRSAEAAKTYRYEMLVQTQDGDEFRSPVATVTTLASLLVLGQNHPNPFNPQTTIPYELPNTTPSMHVRLLILDTTGRVVRTLVDVDQTGGPREAVWNGRDEGGHAVSSGVYFYVLDAGGERRTRKLVLLK